MATRIDQVVGTTDYDGLFASVDPTALVATVKLAASKAGVLERGTVVAGEAGGELKPAASALGAAGTPAGTGENPAPAVPGTTAVYVLAADIDATAATNATAYKCGNFNRKRLLTDGSYKLTAADYEYLRTLGIYTEDVL